MLIHIQRRSTMRNYTKDAFAQAQMGENRTTLTEKVISMI